MKKLILLLFIGFNAWGVFAHDVHYESVLPKQWFLKDQKKPLEGHFLMFKGDQVSIEDGNGKIHHITLQSLSDHDQAYVLEKYKKITQLNEQRSEWIKQSAAQQSAFNHQCIAVLFLLLSLGSFIFLYPNKEVKQFLTPVFALGLCMALFGFTEKAAQSLQSNSIGFMDSVFMPFRPNVHTFNDATYFYVESKGIPTTHEMMVGISNKGWQQQVPIPQCYIGANAWLIPINPTFAVNPIPIDNIHFTRGAIALAANGVPIFNVYTNTGVDSYLDGQLDNYGGHCGRADDYHYHIAPLHLYNYTSTKLPIAFGLDGFPVYGSTEPDGAAMQPLDTNHGHLYKSNYHYHGTPTAPYMIKNFAGTVTEDATHQLIPQAAAKGVRPALTPLSGALITACKPNEAKNGYNLTYTRNGVTDSVVYSWTANGQYPFKFYTNGNLDSSKTYNGFVQCTVPLYPSGIDNLNANEPKLSVYPNPNNGNFYIQLAHPDLKNEIQSVEVYGISGERVYSTNQFQSKVTLNDKAKGIYLLQVKIAGRSITRKVYIGE